MIELIIQDNLYKSKDFSLYEYNSDLNEVKPIILNTHMQDIFETVKHKEHDKLWIENSVHCNFLKNILYNEANILASFQYDAQYIVDTNSIHPFISYWLLKYRCKLVN